MTSENKLVAGIVMPISAIDGCSESHWSDVLDIISEAVEDAGFEPNLVSNSDEVGVIQKRIVQNLYDNPIVICDVSGKNPNVMFELGLRLAFDKPTIIIKDDKTSYSFDTSAIEHIEYPRDLRFAKIVEFKQDLAKKINGTHVAATTNPNYTTFLKHYGEIIAVKIDKKEVSGQEFILDELRNMNMAIQRLEMTSVPAVAGMQMTRDLSRQYDLLIQLPKLSTSTLIIVITEIKRLHGVQDACLAGDGTKVGVSILNLDDIEKIRKAVSTLIEAYRRKEQPPSPRSRPIKPSKRL